MYINKFLGIQELPTMAQSYLRRFLYVILFITFFFSVSGTFFVLFAIDKIGYSGAGLMVSFMMFVQLLIDYPSGSLGDMIGQRKVLSLAFINFGFVYLLLFSAQTLTDFLIVAFFNGVGIALQSGALSTWLDNNYKLVIGDYDKERKIYGFTRTRVFTISRAIGAISFIIGGLLATMFSRQFVFFMQGLLSFFIIIAILYFVTDEKTNDSANVANNSKSSKTQDYFKFLKGGIAFLFSSKNVFFFIIGLALYFVAITIWGQLILFPIYFGYTGSDALASILRTVIFVLCLPLGIYIAHLSKRFSNHHFPYVMSAFFILFFGVFSTLLFFIQPNNEFNLIGIVLVTIIQVLLVGGLLDIGDALRGRILIDLVPSDNRNAVYSLIPTLISVFGIPALIIAGLLIEQYNLIAGIFTASLFAFIGVSCIFLSYYFKESGSTALKEVEARDKDGVPAIG
jgi:MFS family permease